MTEEINRQKSVQLRPLAFDPYTDPIRSTRTGAIFCVHSYPTKINYSSIIPFILAHTKPGEVVYDCFAGTCSTGFAAAACSDSYQVLQRIDRVDTKKAELGPRQAICVELGVLPTFIGKTLLRPIQVDDFESKFYDVMNELESNWGWIYGALDDMGKQGVVRYTMLSDVIKCLSCGSESNFIDLFVDFKSGLFRADSSCPACGNTIRAKEATRVKETIYDDLLNKDRLVVKRVPVSVNGAIGRKRWNRLINEDDLAVLKRVYKAALPSSAKAIPILSGEPRWGEMYRAGYHQGITYLHDFYTRRNFLALSLLYEAANQFPETFRDHFILLVSSYNAAHSSLMTRFVFKNGKTTPVLTSGQPGALYVSGCPVEKNVFHGVRRKLKELLSAIGQIQKWRPRVSVYRRPAQHSGLPDNSVDYVFTDPPYGGNIQYSEISFLSEAWLGGFTDNRYETIVSNFQKKRLQDYENLLTDAFHETFRVLKPGRYLTVVFHSAKGKLWNCLRRSIVKAGFKIVDSSILAKQQTSFKQTTTEGAVKKDPIIAAIKPTIGLTNVSAPVRVSPEEFLRGRLGILNHYDPEERTFDFLFSRYVGSCLASGQDVAVDADEFRELLGSIADQHDGQWFLRETNNE